ncbi:unnamed protein product [Nezara viridula]|uniref:Uncharacterized protein n=1 Tax=Nezara viridula TaxID=85310 RepID=A0A9P0HM36_NEZVI|nr:unnamed protein product [Nezara viridula]
MTTRDQGITGLPLQMSRTPEVADSSGQCVAGPPPYLPDPDFSRGQSLYKAGAVLHPSSTCCPSDSSSFSSSLESAELRYVYFLLRYGSL